MGRASARIQASKRKKKREKEIEREIKVQVMRNFNPKKCGFLSCFFFFTNRLLVDRYDFAHILVLVLVKVISSKYSTVDGSSASALRERERKVRERALVRKICR